MDKQPERIRSKTHLGQVLAYGRHGRFPIDGPGGLWARVSVTAAVEVFQSVTDAGLEMWAILSGRVAFLEVTESLAEGEED